MAGFWKRARRLRQAELGGTCKSCFASLLDDGDNIELEPLKDVGENKNRKCIVTCLNCGKKFLSDLK